MPRTTTPADPAEVEAEAIHFHRFATETAKALPLYRRICQAAAEDLDVVGRLFLAPPEQRRVNLLLAAVHDVVLCGDGEPLAAWYASVTDRPRPVGHGGDDPWPHFRRLALEHDGVADRLATRSTQTNEVGRCAPMLLALAQLAREAPGAPSDGSRPLGLVEIGASAGLNLRLDHYEYRYEPGGAVGGPSPLVLACAVRGDHPPPLPSHPPTIASRVGLDLRPVDLTDRGAARWLVACQWPDQLDRIHRLRTAIALARSDRPRVVAGDAVDDLAPLVDAVPAHALPVVMATWVLAYLPAPRQRALLAQLDRLGAARDLSFVFAEQPLEVPDLPVPPRPDGPDDPRFTALVRLDWRNGQRSATRLADQHPHGTWIEWLAG
ncbi:MAG: hypothetical protein JWM05_1110 [Acidimicrobiales bacterium]|nr:hypothetical protein [Acidimicrobiales bacterium]